MSKMMWVAEDPEIITNNEIEDIRTTVELSIANIREGKLVADSIEYIRSVFSVCKTSIIDVFDINEIIELGTSYLSPYTLRGYIERKPFYKFFTDLFEEIDIPEYDLNKEIVERFLFKMVPMLGIYYADYSRKSTLGIINLLWEYTTTEIRNKLIRECERIINNPEERESGKKILENYLVENYMNFDESGKKGIDSILKI